MLYVGYGVIAVSVLASAVTLLLAFTVAPGCEALNKETKVVRRPPLILN